LPEFQVRASEVTDQLPEALAEVGRKFQLPTPDGPSVVVRFVDEGDQTRASDMYTDYEVIAGKPRQVLVVATDRLMRGAELHRHSGVHHEALHCWMGALFGRGGHQINRWIEEGIAILHDGSGDQVVRWFAEAHLSAGEDVVGVVEQEHMRLPDGLPSHAYAYLATCMIRDEFGPQILRRLLRDSNWRQVLGLESSRDLSVLLAGIKDHAIRDLEKRVANRQHFLRGVQEYNEGRNAEARATLGEYVRLFPHDTFVPLAYACLGKAAFKDGDWPDADFAFQQSTAADPGSGAQSDVVLWSFETARKRGDTERARSSGDRILRDFGYFDSNTKERVRRELEDLPR
jgi:tetratricopeptide (TPR) repeat protein